jgi:hypothetical protein
LKLTSTYQNECWVLHLAQITIYGWRCPCHPVVAANLQQLPKKPHELSYCNKERRKRSFKGSSASPIPTFSYTLRFNTIGQHEEAFRKKKKLQNFRC